MVTMFHYVASRSSEIDPGAGANDQKWIPGAGYNSPRRIFLANRRINYGGDETGEEIGGLQVDFSNSSAIDDIHEHVGNELKIESKTNPEAYCIGVGRNAAFSRVRRLYEDSRRLDEDGEN